MDGPAQGSSESSPGTSPACREGTKKLLVAQRLIAGEVDRGKLAREVGVSNQTIYNVASDLRVHGYTLSIDVNSLKSPPPRSTSTPQLLSNLPRWRSRVDLSGRLLPQPNSTAEVQSREKYYPGEATQVDASPPGRSRGTYRYLPESQASPERTLIEIVGEAMKQVISSISPEVKVERAGRPPGIRVACVLSEFACPVHMGNSERFCVCALNFKPRTQNPTH